MCSNDPLVFTCELNEVVLLRVILPTDEQENTSIGDSANDVALPVGFTADSLVITAVDDATRNITLTLSIENASLLNGGQITCDDTVTNDVIAMAGCPLAGEPSYIAKALPLRKENIHACTCRAAWIIM